MLRNAHGDCETLVALFAKIFVEGHRRILSVRRKYNGLENLNTPLSARREGLQGMFICQGSPAIRCHPEASRARNFVPTPAELIRGYGLLDP